MGKIKTIQKGSDEINCIYYTTEKSKNYLPVYVDRIDCNWVDKEQTFDNMNNGVMLTYTMELEYQGYKDDKLVFRMKNPDLVTYE